MARGFVERTRDAVAAFRGKAIDAPVGWDNSNIGWQQLFGGIIPPWRTAEELFSTRPAKSMLLDVYRTNPIVRACTDEIAKTLPQARLEVGTYSGDEWKPLATHPYLDLVYSPNRRFNYPRLIKYWTVQYKATGIGHIWKWRNRAGSGVTELWPVPSTWVEMVESHRANELYAGWRIAGNPGVQPADDVMVLWDNDPNNLTGALGTTESVFRGIALDSEREGYLAEMLVNLKVPGLSVVTEQPLTLPQRKDVLDAMEKEVGRGRRGNILFSSGKGKIEPMNPLGDLDWPSMAMGLEARICMGFGVPPILIGARIGLERATYSNYEQARRAFYVETMASEWDNLAESLTQGLFVDEGEDSLEFRYRYDELPEFQEDAAQRGARSVSLYNAGVVDLDHAQDIAGVERHEVQGGVGELTRILSSINPPGSGDKQPTDGSGDTEGDTPPEDQQDPEATDDENDPFKKKPGGKALFTFGEM